MLTLSSISVCGRIRQVTPRQLAFLGLGKKMRFPNLFGKSSETPSIFLPPPKTNWRRFEIPKLFTRSSALRSSISLVLGVLPELELPPEESQRMHVETSACV